MSELEANSAAAPVSVVPDATPVNADPAPPSTAVPPVAPTKPKKQLSEKQLATLKRGREAMRAKREAAKAGLSVQAPVDAPPATSSKPTRKRSRKDAEDAILLTNGQL